MKLNMFVCLFCISPTHIVLIDFLSLVLNYMPKNWQIDKFKVLFVIYESFCEHNATFDEVC